MKNNPYQTNKGGVIKAPKSQSQGAPKATVTKGGDLRVSTKNK
jgi:hypothetical protein